mmetsp:Transcript_7279/g.12684  ORF Transcript_7279/g.12684 Transcript_7279/m.12684 type:complete len:274 (+) Transcript_7279:152-973(+)
MPRLGDRVEEDCWLLWRFSWFVLGLLRIFATTNENKADHKLGDLHRYVKTMNWASLHPRRKRQSRLRNCKTKSSHLMRWCETSSHRWIYLKQTRLLRKLPNNCRTPHVSCWSPCTGPGNPTVCMWNWNSNPPSLILLRRARMDTLSSNWLRHGSSLIPSTPFWKLHANGTSTVVPFIVLLVMSCKLWSRRAKSNTWPFKNILRNTPTRNGPSGTRDGPPDPHGTCPSKTIHETTDRAANKSITPTKPMPRLDVSLRDTKRVSFASQRFLEADS